MIHNKFKNYTQISNKVLTDNTLSLEEKGMFCYLFSKPDGWEFHYEIMKQELKENSDKTIRKLLNSLVEKGYITKKQITTKGKFGGIDITFTDKSFIDQQPIQTDIPFLPNGKNKESAKIPPNNTNISNNTDIIGKDNNIVILPTAKTEQTIGEVKNEIYELFRAIYKKHTGNDYLAKNHEFVNLVKAIKQFDKATIVNKIYLFEAMCVNKNAYFTKRGFADFTIGKLISQWNEIVSDKQTFEYKNIFGEEL